MARIPTPLTWKRRNFAVFEPFGMIASMPSRSQGLSLVPSPSSSLLTAMGSPSSTCRHTGMQSAVLGTLSKSTTRRKSDGRGGRGSCLELARPDSRIVDSE